MRLQTSGPSIVKAIRQRALLNVWIRQFAAQQQPPSISDFRPDNFEEEKQDMLIYALADQSATPRMIITYDGARISRMYNVVGKGQPMQNLITPPRAAAIVPLYYECIARQRPVYAVFGVKDVNGTSVDLERLLLPFSDGERVTHIIASLKLISLEGSFQETNLLRNDEVPVFTVAAAIEQGLDPPVRKVRPVEDDVTAA